MANAGGAWDNAKKYVEVDLREKGTPLHAATVVGDTVGDPFKDTTSVALNPIIKFSTLFGLLAVEIAVEMKQTAQQQANGTITPVVGVVMLVIALVFVWRSFYAMRIPQKRARPTCKTVRVDSEYQTCPSSGQAQHEPDRFFLRGAVAYVIVGVPSSSTRGLRRRSPFHLRLRRIRRGETRSRET